MLKIPLISNNFFIYSLVSISMKKKITRQINLSSFPSILVHNIYVTSYKYDYLVVQFDYLQFFFSIYVLSSLIFNLIRGKK